MVPSKAFTACSQSLVNPLAHGEKRSCCETGGSSGYMICFMIIDVGVVYWLVWPTTTHNTFKLLWVGGLSGYALLLPNSGQQGVG